jgi:hypothetical protein
MSNQALTIRLPEAEYNSLKSYCERTHQTKTAVLRHLIRSLDQQPSLGSKSFQADPSALSSPDWQQLALAWQQLAFANFRLCRQVSATSNFFETDAFKCLVLYWLDSDQPSPEDKRALLRLFADVLSLDLAQHYLGSS